MPKLVDRTARRRELGEAVLGVLARDGAGQLTLRRIAHEAGWSVGVVQHYFSDRDELIAFANELAFERADRRIQVILNKRRPVLTKLRLVLAEGLPVDRERIEEWAAWLAFWNRAITDARLGSDQARRYAKWRDLILELLREAEADGELKDGLDLPFEACCLVAFVDGLGIQALFEPERLTPGVLESTLSRSLERLGMSGDRDRTAS